MSGYWPNSEIVAVAWLKSLAGLNNAVATELPSDTSTWSSTGFVQVLGVGGTPRAYLPVARPVIGVSCWAVAPGSGRPPWNKANQLAEIVRRATYDVRGALVVTPTAYQNATLLAAVPLSEPRRIRDDQGDYARFDLDVELHWLAVDK